MAFVHWKYDVLPHVAPPAEWEQGSSSETS
jgi:hypothetical protein